MRTAVVVCPGRGTYNKTELGWLSRHFADRDLIARFDGRRARLGRPTLSELDGASTYSFATHSRGDNASALIYAATYGDFTAIADDVRVIAVTGNSMGWYSALSCAGALTPENGFDVVNTMGTLMQEQLIGGQTVYPFVGEDWRPDMKRKAELLDLVAEIDCRVDHKLALSIDLGGMLVLGGNAAGLAAFEAGVPPLDGRFPLRLANHAAFHTRLQEPVAAVGRERILPQLFRQPRLPLIDGRGHIWWPHASNLGALWDYTLGQQVTQAYNFTKAIQVAAREFAPDVFIVTGPGTTLNGAVAQSLIQTSWRGMADKADFQRRQAESPILLSMGVEEQRMIAVSTRAET